MMVATVGVGWMEKPVMRHLKLRIRQCKPCKKQFGFTFSIGTEYQVIKDVLFLVPCFLVSWILDSWFS